MGEPERSDDEIERLEALRRYEILDTPPEKVFDDITRVAALVTECPMALISLVDADRQWFKARCGLDVAETERSMGFCSHAVTEEETLVVEDARLDPRFAENPLVAGAPWLRFYAGVPLRDSGGHAIGALCVLDCEPRRLAPDRLASLALLAEVVTELIERRPGERAAARGDLMHARFWELSLDMLCVSSFDGYYTALNPTWERVLGHSIDEMMSQPFLDYVHPEDRERTAREAVAMQQHGHRVVGFENRYRCADGTYKWLRWNASSDLEARAVFAVARDISDAKRLEGELRRAAAAAAEASSAKSAFLANMSHELRTPLNSVIGFANLLRKNRHGRLSEKELDWVDRIVANGKSLLALINDVLDLSKIEAGHLELDLAEVDVVPLVAEVVRSMEGRAADQGSGIAMSGAMTVPPVTADAQRLRQVLINLVENGLKFGGAGGVEVRLISDEAAPGRPLLRIDVADGGIGIPKTAIERIFEPFRQADETTSRRYGGTGLGLPISRRLCREMGLELTCTSSLGEGATFSILFRPDAPLPVHRAPEVTWGETPSSPAIDVPLEAIPGLRGDDGEATR